jgi:hypothetical protein
MAADCAFSAQHGGLSREEVAVRQAAKRERRIARRKSRRETPPDQAGSRGSR